MLISLVLLIMAASPVLAESNGWGSSRTAAAPVSANLEDEGAEAIAITVIIPPAPERPTPQPVTKRVYPINVAEGYNYDGVRELVRIYELLPNESPDWIDTDSFERNGYYYQLAEITRQTDVSHTVREHTEVVEVQTASNDLAGVIAGLSPAMDFVDEDGYVGILHLDIHSIDMTQDGTRSSSRTVSQTREYPHLSTPDLSLIPQTVTADGRTYTLGNVDWRTNTSTPIDFNSVPTTYTAHATYTRTATSTVATGYTTRASYSGTLTRVSAGDVRFVATFIGTPIVSPIVNQPNQSASDHAQEDNLVDVIDNAAVEQAGTGNETPEVGITDDVGNENNGSINSNNSSYGSSGIYNEPATPETETKESAQETSKDNPKNGISPLLILFGVFAAVLFSAVVILMLKFKKKADMLESVISKDSAGALRSRMRSIVKQDRKELAEYADDEYGAYEQDDTSEDAEDNAESEGYVIGYHRLDEDEDGDDE